VSIAYLRERSEEMKLDSIGFIGTGNMATALIKGILEGGIFDKSRIYGSDKDQEKLKKISKELGIGVYSSNISLAQISSIVVLSVKPQSIKEVLEEVKDYVGGDKLIVSIAAGVPIAFIRSFLGRKVPIVRVMPNTPALIRRGISGIATDKRLSDEIMDMIFKIFSAVGEAIVVEERMMDAITAISGSGPGYVFRFMECMVEGAIQMGFEEEVARRLVVNTFLGASELARISQESLSSLREKVTSPGGTTEAALKIFEQRGLKTIILDALKAAKNRGEEIGSSYNYTK